MHLQSMPSLSLKKTPEGDQKSEIGIIQKGEIK